jgi:hypothetical protein
MESLLSAVPTNYTPMGVNRQTTHLLIWQVYGYAAQRLNGPERIRLPEIIIDYFVLKFQEPHSAQVRVVDFLMAVCGFATAESSATSSNTKKDRRKLTKHVSSSAATQGSIRCDSFLRLLEKSNTAKKQSKKNAKAHGRDENDARPKGTDDFKHFTTVLCQLIKEAGSIHAFVENHGTGLHVVSAPIARRVLRDMPSYRMVSDELRNKVNETVDDHSKMMSSGHGNGAEQQEMIEIDDVLHLAMSLWYEERTRAKKSLIDMFVEGDENDDGFLTLDEFRDLIKKVDPRRSGVEVTHMYREALSLTVSRSVSSGKVGNISTSGGITPDAFATIGILHGLLVMPDPDTLSLGNGEEEKEKEEKEKEKEEQKQDLEHKAIAVAKKLSQEENDILVFGAMATTFSAQRNDLLKAVVGNESLRSKFNKLETLLATQKVVNLGTCMDIYGELSILLLSEEEA